MCGCENDMYYDVHAKRCATLPLSLDADRLLFLLEYEHGG